MKFLKSVLLVSLSFPTLLPAQLGIKAPAGWIDLDTPAGQPPEVIYLRKIASEDRAIEVTVIAMKAVTTADGIRDAVSGSISGMKKHGLIPGKTEDVTIKGFPAKHISGEFRSKEYEGAYLADTKIIFSDAAMVTVSISIDDARGTRELGKDVIEWVTIPGKPASSPVIPQLASEHVPLAEKIGYYGFFVALAIGLWKMTRKNSKRKQDPPAKRPA